MSCGRARRRSGDCPALRSVVQAEGGEAGEVDRAGSGEDVGEDAGLAAASGVASAPGPAREVADLAFYDRAVCPVGLLPGRVALPVLGVLQRGLVRVDADHSS